ncbi:apolipoprotein N-acyltransferase, partial [Candidatus Omnitrophota bacterium]
MDKYLGLSGEAARPKPDLIIWPEAAMPVVLEEEPAYIERVRGFAKEIDTPLVLGALTTRDDLYYNSALLISAEGRILGKYDKLHLVPFGEYIPLRGVFSLLEAIVPIGDFVEGEDFTVFSLDQLSFSVLICFEDLFPELARGFVKRGAGFLINITNDAWFGNTASPYQHLAASVLRAVENRRHLVRAANTGVSGFISPLGEILSLVQDQDGRVLFIDGFMDQSIEPSVRITSFYTRFGDIFILACFLLSLYVIASRLKGEE